MNLQKEIKDYLHYCNFQKKLNPQSLKAYAIDLRQFSEYAGALPMQALSKETISGYMQELHQKFSPRTAKRKLASIRAFLNHMEFEEIIETNPIRKIRTKFREPKTLPKTIPLRFIEKLLSVTMKEEETATTSYGKFVAIRDRAILETLFATGARVSEVCSLRTKNINLEDGIIRIMGKGSKERVFQIGNNETLCALRQYQSMNKSQSDFFL